MPPRRLILRRDLPIVGIALLIASLAVAVFATGAVERVRIARLVRGGTLGAPIRVDEPTFEALWHDHEPAASAYLIANADAIDLDDLESYVRIQRLVLYAKKGIAPDGPRSGGRASLNLLDANTNKWSKWLRRAVPERSELVIDASTTALVLEDAYGVRLPLPPEVAAHVRNLRARDVAISEAPGVDDPSAGDVINLEAALEHRRIDWDAIFGTGSAPPE